MTDSNDKKRKDLQERIRELEAALGRKQIKIDFYQKMIDLAKEDYDLDLKKYFYLAIEWFRQHREVMNYSLTLCIGVSVLASKPYGLILSANKPSWTGWSVLSVRSTIIAAITRAVANEI